MPDLFFITGAESTGKSTLTAQLAQHYQAVGTREFARDYLNNLGHAYSIEDLHAISRGQIEIIRNTLGEPLTFVDTDLINLKVWYDEVFHEVPSWLTDFIRNLGKGYYLVCQPDIPWEPDPLRENPDRREFLNQRYEEELRSAGFPFYRVTGMGESRLQCAISIVDAILSDTSRINRNV
jgi:nicotinamide riboside kinase